MTTFKPIPEEQYLENPGYLKLDLMLKGVRVDSSLFAKEKILKKYLLSPHIFGNLDLVLPEDTHVSVPYQENFSQQSPYRLRNLRGKYFLTTPSGSKGVKLIPHPRFYSYKINDHLSLGDIIACHGGYISLALGGHRYLQSHLDEGDPKEESKKREITVDELIGLLERIRKDQKIDILTLSAWDASGEDGGIAQIEPYIRAIKRSFNLLLSVEIHLPRKHLWIDRTYAMGADSVCYHLGNLCSHGAEETKESLRVSQELDFLKHATDIFPPGTIMSHLTMGNRPFEEVVEDIDKLTKIGVLPILTASSREAILAGGYTTAQLAPLFGYVYNSAKKNNITMNWFGKLAPFIAPIEGRFFSGDTPRFKLALLNFYQSRIFGGSISAGLSNLRRKLRVRHVKRT